MHKNKNVLKRVLWKNKTLKASNKNVVRRYIEVCVCGKYNE